MYHVGVLSVLIVAATDEQAYEIAKDYNGDMLRLLNDAHQAGSEFIITSEESRRVPTAA